MYNAILVGMVVGFLAGIVFELTEIKSALHRIADELKRRNGDDN